MGPAATLRLRRSAAQRHALAPLERQIRAADPHPRRKYLRDFSSVFRGYEMVLEPDDLRAAYAAADVLLVGDYHALPQSQNFAAGLVRSLAGRRSVILALETVFARDQAVLDEWSRGELEEAELRERIRFDLDWGYDWTPFYALLETARSCRSPIFGLDCIPRNDLRRINVRDRHAAEKIGEIRERHPQAAMVVLIGESHLAPNHLPAYLRARRPEDRILTVLQNLDPLYWRAAGEHRERVEAVRVRQDVVCVFNSTPLEKYESYRLYLERWQQDTPRPPDLAPAFYNLVDGLLRFLNIDKYAAKNGTQPRFLVDQLPEVYFRLGSERVRRMLQRKALHDSEVNGIFRALEQSGCCFVPELGAVLIERFELRHGAEAAARCLHHICGRGRSEAEGQRDPEDRFYRAVLEAALGDFGAHALCPGRPTVREADLSGLYARSRQAAQQLGLGSRRDLRLLDLVAKHKHYEANLRYYHQRPAQLNGLMNLKPDRFAYATRLLGSLLGGQLYDSYLSGHIAKRFLRALYFRSLAKSGAARTLYFSLQRRLRRRTKRLLSSMAA
jgi:hypothetical protein